MEAKVTIGGYPALHISDCVRITHKSVQALRRLIFEGNSIRKLKAIRDGSRIYVPYDELFGYPFVRQGRQVHGHDVYHVDEKGHFEFCEMCTYTADGCERRQKAEAVNVADCPR